MMFNRFLATIAVVMSFPLAAAAANDLADPQGPVILTIIGQITSTNTDGAAVFDLAMLDAIETRETTTETPWHDGTPVFSGPLGLAVLEAVGASGETLRITALNDYVVDVPVEDLRNYPVIFATRLNGDALSVREKGPLFLIYPFSEFPELLNEVYFGRSAWQIRQIEVLD
jgi:hypothetical protein